MSRFLPPGVPGKGPADGNGAPVTTARFVDRGVVRLVRYWTDHDSHSWRAILARVMLKVLGVDWQPMCVGEGLVMPHATTGSVVHRRTRIGRDVMVFHGVTVGRARPWAERARPGIDEGVVLEDGVVLGANSTVMFRAGHTLRIGRGTILGAGSVLLQSTGPGEVWAGNPAVRVR